MRKRFNTFLGINELIYSKVDSKTSRNENIVQHTTMYDNIRQRTTICTYTFIYCDRKYLMFCCCEGGLIKVKMPVTEK